MKTKATKKGKDPSWIKWKGLGDKFVIECSLCNTTLDVLMPCSVTMFSKTLLKFSKNHEHAGRVLG